MAAAGVPLLDLAQMMDTSAVMIEGHCGCYDSEQGASHVQRVFVKASALDNVDQYGVLDAPLIE